MAINNFLDDIVREPDIPDLPIRATRYVLYPN